VQQHSVLRNIVKNKKQKTKNKKQNRKRAFTPSVCGLLVQRAVPRLKRTTTIEWKKLLL